MLSQILILEQKFTSRYVAPLGHIRLAISQQVLAVALYCCLQKIIKIERMLTLINEYKNCTTDPYSGKITSVLFHFIYLGFDGGYPKGLLTLWI
jgi:hypothetical protein